MRLTMAATTSWLAAAIAALSLSALASHADAAGSGNDDYSNTVLVADNASFDPQIVDPNMLDAWGIALRPPGAGGHIWISNAETGTSSEYIGDVNGVPLHQDGLTSVPLDTPRFTDHGYAFVTGQVYNAASDIVGQPVEFPVSGPADNDSTNPPTVIPGGTSGSAKFIFVTEDGCINAWRSNTATAMLSAPVVVDYSKEGNFPYAANSVFSGDAITTHAFTLNAQNQPVADNHLFVTDFRNNVIEVFNNQWQDVTSSYTFQVPASVGDLHPFNIMDLNDHLFVAYAGFDPGGDEGMENLTGAGLGEVVEYNEDGSYVQSFGTGGQLNAPWGMAIAPSTFGAAAGDLLVANFGDGSIAAFNPTTGAFVDDLQGSDGRPVDIDGIWGLTFGNGVSLGDANSLYYTAGPNSEQDGEFGRLSLIAVPEPEMFSLILLCAGIFGCRRHGPAPFSRSCTRRNKIAW
jgi:uncharacterized protein (TIGR03118 family)